jgi:hypothetical protein
MMPRFNFLFIVGLCDSKAIADSIDRRIYFVFSWSCARQTVVSFLLLYMTTIHDFIVFPIHCKLHMVVKNRSCLYEILKAVNLPGEGEKERELLSRVIFET